MCGRFPDPAKNISQEQRTRLLLIFLEDTFLKYGLKTNCTICIQVCQFLNVEFLNCMVALVLLSVVDYI